MIANIVNLVASLVLAAARVAGHKSEAFQAVAHLYVGGLFGAWGVGRRGTYLALALALTGVESLTFAATKATGVLSTAMTAAGVAFLGGAVYSAYLGWPRRRSSR